MIYNWIWTFIKNDERLPDPVFVSILLDGATISDDGRKWALALGKDMKFEDMKPALKRLFKRSIATRTHSDTIFKQEAAFCSKRTLKKY